MGVCMSYSLKVLLLSIYQHSNQWTLQKGEKKISWRDFLVVPLSKYVGRDSNKVQSGLFLLGFKILCRKSSTFLRNDQSIIYIYNILVKETHFLNLHSFSFMFLSFLFLRIVDNGNDFSKWVEIREISAFSRGVTVYIKKEY